VKTKEVTRAKLDLIESRLTSDFANTMFDILPEKLKETYNYNSEDPHDNILANKWADYYVILNEILERCN
jgi:hypothetical protein